MEYFGINPIKHEGYKFEAGFGYSRHVNLKINDKKFVPILIPQVVSWGVKDLHLLTGKEIKCKIMDKKDFLEFSVTTQNISCLTKVCGCVLIKFGESPWGPYTNLQLGQVKDWKSILVDVKWSFKAEGIADLIFDVWITKNREGLPEEKDIELMVWLDSNNLQPPGDYKGKINNFEIFYIPLEDIRKFNPYATCGTISYFYLDKEKRKVEFDLLQLIKDSAKYFGIKNVNNYWIRSIDFGVEYRNNTKVIAKIYKLAYGFIK